MMNERFERFERTTYKIASHCDYPGKSETLRSCLEDIEGLFSDGELTFEQRSRLVAILTGGETYYGVAS